VRRAWAAVVVLAACTGQVPDHEWPHVLGDDAGTRWSPAGQIDTATVAALVQAWEWRVPTADDSGRAALLAKRGGFFQTTPVMRDGRLFLSTPLADAVVLDAATGVEVWRFDSGVDSLGRVRASARSVHRGVAVWGHRRAERVFLAARGTLWALDAATGRPVVGFGNGGAVDLVAGLRRPADRRHVEQTTPPALWRDVVIVGSAIGDALVYEGDPPGDVQAFDATTGKRLWSWSPVPTPDDPHAASWGSRARAITGHANVWSFMTVDTARGWIVLPVSSPSNDWYGGGRPGDNKWAESVVCLDARTGRLVWARQLVHHGLWDYDPAAPPLLVSATIDGRVRELVVQAGKTGFVYVLDRLTGEPIWPMEERAVPASDVPGEVASPTQPHPTRPAPVSPQGFTRADVVDFTPDLRDSVLARMAGWRDGPLFTPPSREGTVVLPGWLGGVGWGGTSVDLERGLLLVKSTTRPSLARLVPRQSDGAGAWMLDTTASPSAPLHLTFSLPRSDGGRFPPLTLPITKPPYGTLTAIDLATGEQRWQVPLGDTPEVRDHPALQSLGLPPLGVAGPVGGVTTAGGLTFLTGGGKALLALETATGRLRWSASIGATGWANPMTYQWQGRQFVVQAVGSGIAARLVAFALPLEGAQ